MLETKFFLNFYNSTNYLKKICIQLPDYHKSVSKSLNLTTELFPHCSSNLISKQQALTHKLDWINLPFALFFAFSILKGDLASVSIFLHNKIRHLWLAAFSKDSRARDLSKRLEKKCIPKQRQCIIERVTKTIFSTQIHIIFFFSFYSFFILIFLDLLQFSAMEQQQTISYHLTIFLQLLFFLSFVCRKMFNLLTFSLNSYFGATRPAIFSSLIVRNEKKNVDSGFFIVIMRSWIEGRVR